MKTAKRVIGHLKRCYALAPLRDRGELYFLAASELPEPCLLYGTDGELREVVREKAGGTVAMVQVPGTDGCFLAVNRFYSFNDAADAVITLYTRVEDGRTGRGRWEACTLAALPYVHRIDIVERGGVRYLVACQLKSGQNFEGDWSCPGRVYAAVLPEDLSGYDEGNLLELELLKDGLLKNHGYSRTGTEEAPACLVSSESGIFRFLPPASPGLGWTEELLCADPASDAVLVDLDGDGVEELCTITPFHGDRVCIYHRSGPGWERICETEQSLPFCHAIYGGPLSGQNVLIIGQRAGSRDLLVFVFDREQGQYVCRTLDHGAGSANVMVCRSGGQDVIVSANRETDEIAMYTVDWQAADAAHSAG